MAKLHDFASTIVWTGNRGEGTRAYKGYDCTWDIAVPGKEIIHCSNDLLLGGDPAKMNPEDLLISALSACHMLWYLHLASNSGAGNGNTSARMTGPFTGKCLEDMARRARPAGIFGANTRRRLCRGVALRTASHPRSEGRARFFDCRDRLGTRYERRDPQRRRFRADWCCDH